MIPWLPDAADTTFEAERWRTAHRRCVEAWDHRDRRIRDLAAAEASEALTAWRTANDTQETHP